MKKNAFLSIMLGGVLLIGCSKPSNQATLPAVIPPVQSETQTNNAPAVNAAVQAPAQAAVPVSKDGAKPAPTDGQGESVSD